jgi:malonyl-CoA O-methyltransferase
MNDRFRVDRRAMTRAFNRASLHYDAAAALQGEVRAELLSRLEFFALKPQLIVDLGCGTAHGAAALRARYRRAQVLAIDIAPGMLRAARRRGWPWRRFARVCADALALPLAAQSVDLVYSNLMLHWCDDPALAFAEVRRVLRPGGLLLFSTLGAATLQELRDAWASVDTTPHVSAFADMPLLAAALQHAGLREPVMDRDLRLRHYPQAATLMGELREIGEHNAAVDRRRSLTGRHRLALMCATYEHQRGPKGLPATWEIIYGAAFAPAEQPGRQGHVQPVPAGETHVPLSALGRRTRP